MRNDLAGLYVGEAEDVGQGSEARARVLLAVLGLETDALERVRKYLHEGPDAHNGAQDADLVRRGLLVALHPFALPEHGETLDAAPALVAWHLAQ